MASSIDATKPTAGTAQTADVRANFAAAKSEIEAIQVIVSGTVQAAQIQSGALVNITAALTGTEYAATPAPAITAYAAGQRFMVTFDLACPAAPTLKLNGIATPPNLVRQNVDGTFSNLAAGAFPAGWKSPVVAVSATQYLVENVPPRRRTLTTTRDLSAATGNVSITGSGFKPSIIRLSGLVDATIIRTDGFASNLGAHSISKYGDSGLYTHSATLIGSFLVTGANYVVVTLFSFDNDGITVTYTKTGAPTGTATLYLDLEE